MRIWLVGSGGREHALAWKIAQSPLCEQLFCAPGNPGTAILGANVSNIAIATTDIDAQVRGALDARVDLVVVGPEAPLALGLVDRLSARGVPCFGPTAAAARIEASKAFAKDVMARAQIPTAAHGTFDEPVQAKLFAAERHGRVAVKADGLASGKGVIICGNVAESDTAIDKLGGRLVIEELLVGSEVSILALCDGERAVTLPPARDHKRLLDGDRGPNTGGMGAVSPAPDADAALVAWTHARVLLPALSAMREAGMEFRGVLYAGLMLTSDGPRVLEFNARLGDPEAEAILPRLSDDLVPMLAAGARGDLRGVVAAVRSDAAVTVVLASAGYPDAPRAGDPIAGLSEARALGGLVFHAGTAPRGPDVVTAGGRVLAVTALGVDVAVARARAYAACAKISFAGMQFRQDIAV